MPSIGIHIVVSITPRYASVNSTGETAPDAISLARPAILSWCRGFSIQLMFGALLIIKFERGNIRDKKRISLL